jgi:hypothetical protein
MSSEKIDWSKSADQEVNVSGTAQNAKAGALLMTGPEDAILVDGLSSWDQETVGKVVSVTGTVRRVPGYPKADPAKKLLMQGTASGRDTWVLELKEFEVID